MSPRGSWAGGAAAVVCAPLAVAQSSYVHFEGAQVHPVRVSADGTRLYAVNTADGRLEVYSLADPDRPLLLRDIPVGLEPVSITPRTTDEVWVANSLSDSVSVVSVSQGSVIATLRAADEPADVAFAAGRAFVTAAASDAVHVFDAATRAQLQTIAIPGKDPKALAVRGDSVWVLVHRSGNDTTVVPFAQAPAPPPPTNSALPPAPQQSLVVAEDDPAWSSVVTWSVPDRDVYEIDATSLAIVRNFAAVGTTNFDLAVHPATGELFVANTDARNRVRFEPNLRGHALDSRVTRIVTQGAPSVTAFDLNTGFDYAVLPNAAARALALAEPTGIALAPATGRLYVAAQGTDRVGVLDLAGNVLARIELGEASGAVIDTRNKRGPRGLALHPAAPRLYVLERLSSSIAVIDTQSNAVIREQPLAHDPLPPTVRVGRRFLYDAKLAGNGTFSCAACHVDGDLDGLAWDLGDPGGVMTDPPAGQLPGLEQFHPMKGPMTTQTLRGLDVAPFHWRGDRNDLPAFNGVFASLMGGVPLAPSELALLVDFLHATRFPPNPNQNLDRTYKIAPAGANQAVGLAAFEEPIADANGLSCASCHTFPSGTLGLIIAGAVLLEPQQMKIPQLRNMYRKTGMPAGTASGKSGFGFIHDGSLPSLTAFLAQPVFSPWPATTKDDLVQFLLAFDTGTAPAVGYQVTVTSANASSSTVASDVALLQSQAALGNCDLIAKGVFAGEQRGLLYDPSNGRFESDLSGFGPFSWTQLKNQTLASQATWTFSGVPPGSGARNGVDRDLDGTLDGMEGVENLGGAIAGCAGEVVLFANGEPAVGNAQFAVVAANAPPWAPGRVAVVVGRGGGFMGMGKLSVFATPASDAQGFAFRELPLAEDPALVGVQFYAFGLFADACAPGQLARTDVLRITVMP